jgi:hypothetical protein
MLIVSRLVGIFLTKIFASSKRIVDPDVVFDFLSENLDDTEYPIFELEYLFNLISSNQSNYQRDEFIVKFCLESIQYLTYCFPEYFILEDDIFNKDPISRSWDSIRSRLRLVLKKFEISKVKKDEILESLKNTFLLQEGILFYKSVFSFIFSFLQDFITRRSVDSFSSFPQ